MRPIEGKRTERTAEVLLKSGGSLVRKTEAKIRERLPSNYKMTQICYQGASPAPSLVKQADAMGIGEAHAFIVIQGYDNERWTLDGHVIPQLALDGVTIKEVKS
jgi:hypothetical protein